MAIQTRSVHERMRRLQASLQKKEKEARVAREKGMHSTFGNLMCEISELKRKVRKCQMGS